MESQEKYLTDLQRKQLALINHYGLDHQLKKLEEECAELIQSILKDEDPFKVNIISEMADVENLIEQIKLKDSFIGSGINAVKEYKINRQLDRISQRLQDTGLEEKSKAIDCKFDL